MASGVTLSRDKFHPTFIHSGPQNPSTDQGSDPFSTMPGLLVVVGGPAGCGKTTVGQELATRLDASFLEGDSLHPPSNIHKMAEGIPLTDDDRWGWLENLAHIGSVRASESSSKICVASCSALKKSYRDCIRKYAGDVEVAFVFIPCDSEELYRRVSQRKGHYMKSNMIQSQLADMQIPEPSEAHCFVYQNTVDIDDAEEKLKALQSKLSY